MDKIDMMAAAQQRERYIKTASAVHAKLAKQAADTNSSCKKWMAKGAAQVLEALKNAR